MTNHRFGMIVTVILSAIIIIALCLTLAANHTPLNKILKNYQRNYPDATFLVQKITGSNAEILNSEIRNYCPDFSLDSYYLAKIDDAKSQKSLIFIINPLSGGYECQIDKSLQEAQQRRIILTVNDEPIYADEVLTAYNNIPANARTNNSAKDALDQVINTKLLLQDARSKGIAISDAEIDNAISSFMAANSLTADTLNNALVASNSSMSDFKRKIKDQLTIAKEVDAITKDVKIPTDAEAESYYAENNASFVTTPTASVRQLLLYTNGSNDAERLEFAKSIAAMMKFTDFCKLITEYSEDNATKGKCGLYEFKAGELLPEFEQAVFSSEPGAAKIVKTRLGYHILFVDKVNKATHLSYSAVSQNIKDFLLLQKKGILVQDYIAKLKTSARVVENTK